MDNTINSLNIQVLNDGAPVLGLSKIQIIDINNFTEIPKGTPSSLLLRQNYRDTLTDKPIFTKDGEIYKYAYSNTTPDRYTLLSNNTITLYTSEVLSTSTEELGNGFYKIGYDFTSSPVRQIQIYIEDLDTHELLPQTEFDYQVLIDYNQLSEMYDKLNRFIIDSDNNKVFMDFNNGYGLYEFKLEKIAHIPNTVDINTVSPYTFLKIDKAFAKASDKVILSNQKTSMDTQKDTLLKKINMLSIVKSLLQEAQPSEINTWSNNLTNVYDRSAVLLTGSGIQGETSISCDIINLNKSDVIYIDGDIYVIENIIEYIQLDKALFGQYYLNALLDVYSRDNYDNFTLLTGSTRSTMLANASNILYIKPSISSVITNIPLSKNYNNKQISKLSTLKDIVVYINDMYKLNYISTIGSLLNNSSMLLTLINTTNALNYANTDLRNLEALYSSVSEQMYKSTLSYEEFNNRLKLFINWKDPVEIFNEKIVSYEVAYFSTTPDNLTVIEEIISQQKGAYDSALTDWVNDFKSKFGDNTKYESVMTKQVKELTISPITSKLSVNAVNDIIVTTSPIFLTTDTPNNNGGIETIVEINNVQYYIAEYISPTSVKLSRDVAAIVASGTTVLKRSKFPIYSNTNSVTSDITLDVDLDDITIIYIRTVNEYGLKSKWSLPIRITVKECKYQGSNKLLLDYVKEDLLINLTFLNTITTKPNPPTLNTSLFKWYDLSSVNSDYMKRKGDLINKIKSTEQKITNVRNKISELTTENLIDLSKDYNRSDLNEDAPTFFPKIKLVYNDLVRLPANIKKQINDLNTGSSAESLQNLLTLSVKQKKELKAIEEPAQYKKYKIGFTFSEPTSSHQIVQYKCSYKIKINDSNSVNVNPTITNNTETIRLDEKIIDSSILHATGYDSVTGKKLYPSSSSIRKFEVDVLPNVEYEFMVSAIDVNGIQSDWSNSIIYKVEVAAENDSLINAEYVTIDSIINDAISIAMLEQRNEIEKSKMDLSNISEQVNQQMKVIYDRITKAELSVSDSNIQKLVNNRFTELNK